MFVSCIQSCFDTKVSFPESWGHLLCQCLPSGMCGTYDASSYSSQTVRVRFGFKTCRSVLAYIAVSWRRRKIPRSRSGSSGLHYTDGFTESFQESPIFQLQATFAAMQTCKEVAFNPVKLVESLKLRTTEQQDAQECVCVPWTLCRV